VKRLLLFGLTLILGGIVLASAATLEVKGGTLQVFPLEVRVELPMPATTTAVDAAPTVATSQTP
jgi:hypothetical protein